MDVLLGDFREALSLGSNLLKYPGLVMLMALPIAIAIFVSLLPKNFSWFLSKLVFLQNLVILLFVTTIVWNFDFSDPRIQFSQSIPWISEFGIQFSLAIDSISLWLILLSSLIFLIFFRVKEDQNLKSKGYLFFYLILQAGVYGAFLAQDGLSFYLSWELMMLPMYFLLSGWGSAASSTQLDSSKQQVSPSTLNFRAEESSQVTNSSVALRFVYFTAFGSLAMLLAIIYLGLLHNQQFGSWSFLFSDWHKIKLERVQEIWLFIGFAVAFFVKIPIFPLHLWLPSTLKVAPLSGLIIFVGILFKQGLYGLIKINFTLFPHAFSFFTPLMILFGVFSLFYGGLIAFSKIKSHPTVNTIREVFVYSTISHLGFCLVGLASGNIYGLTGCISQMINHGFLAAGIFYLIYVIGNQSSTGLIEGEKRELVDEGTPTFSGLISAAPVLGLTFFVFSLSMVALPFTNSFVPELLLIYGSFSKNIWLGVTVAFGMFLSACYVLGVFREAFLGKPNTIEPNTNLRLADDSTSDSISESVARRSFQDISLSKFSIVFPLVFLVILLGLYPGLVIDNVKERASSILKIQREGLGIKETESPQFLAISQLPSSNSKI